MTIINFLIRMIIGLLIFAICAIFLLTLIPLFVIGAILSFFGLRMDSLFKPFIKIKTFAAKGYRGKEKAKANFDTKPPGKVIDAEFKVKGDDDAK